MTFVNISNHPSSGWSEEQKAAARRWGAAEPTTTSQIKDIPFPAIPPEADMDVVRRMADDMFKSIYTPNFRGAVHLMGEQSFCFALSGMLIEAGITVLVSTTAREVVEKDGVKTSTFKFVRFRALNPRR